MLINKSFKFINKKIILIFFFLTIYSSAESEIIILSDCNSNQETFKKNEYILDLEKSLMIRNFIYDNKTYKRLRVTDLKTKKENSIKRFIYSENNFILSEKIGYPQFYTQLLFEKNSLDIKVKTVIDNEIGISILSKCKKKENFDNKS